MSRVFIGNNNLVNIIHWINVRICGFFTKRIFKLIQYIKAFFGILSCNRIR